MIKKIEKTAVSVLGVLVMIFILVWAGKSKKPIDNSITENTKGTAVESVWWEQNETEIVTKDASIPDDYIKVPGTDNLYMIIKEDKVTDYVIRTIKDDGSSDWEIFNKNISSAMTHVEGDIYKYIKDGQILYFRYIENEDGTYSVEYVQDYEENTENTVKQEVIRETKVENGFIVVYETLVYKTYNSAGELINTRTEGPVVVSKTKEPDISKENWEWINTLYNEKCENIKYEAGIESALLELINENREKKGNSAFTSNNSSEEKLISKVAAADLLTHDMDYNSDFFTELEKKYPNYNMVTVFIPASGNDAEIAQFINEQFDTYDNAIKIRYGNAYKKIGITVANTGNGYFVIEIYN